MAKLSGVVPSNEVEVEGVKYRKVEREAQAGDIVRVLVDDYIDVEMDAFYSVINEDGETGFYDDCGDFRDGAIQYYPRDFDVYEKVTEPAAVEYREVKRVAKVGERIKIVKRWPNEDRYVVGDVFVTSSVRQSDGYVRVDSLGERVISLEEYVVLEPVNTAKPAEPAPQTKRLTVGDFAKVIASDDSDHNYEIGSVVKIAEDAHDSQPYRAERADGTIGNWLFEDDIEPATEAEFNAQKPQPERLKVGEYAKVLDGSNGFSKRGDIVKITQDDESSVPFNSDYIDGSYAGWHYAKSLVRATESEVEAAKKDAERTKNIGEFADGGYAVVVDASKSDFLRPSPNGTYVKVAPVPPEPYYLSLTHSDGDYGGYCDADALRKVSREEYEAATKPEPVFNVGDYAKVTCDVMEFRKNDIVRITQDKSCGYISPIFDFEVDRIGKNTNGFISAKNIEKISAEEIARIEEEAKWAAIGRKVGEFKRGDVVSFVKDGGSKTGVGTVEDSVRDGDAIGVRLSGAVYEGTYAGVFFDRGDTASLIVPVEQRFDRAKSPQAEGGASTSK